MIEFQRTAFRYDPSSPLVLDPLDLRIEEGEFLGVIGPNGAGKSTFLRLLLGVLRPTSGRVLIDGRDVRSIPSRELARQVAAVPQEESLEFPFSVEEVVLLGRASRLGPFGFESQADVDAAAAAMRETGVDHLARRPFHALSGGERKRVVLARALAQAAPTLILDEPAAALDIHHQIAIFDLLAARNRAGATVIVVVHDLNLAAAYCRRLLLLRPPQRATTGTGTVATSTAGPIADRASALIGPVEEVLTYRRVRDVFGVDVYVGVNEVTGHRFLIPMSTPPSST